jgi:hypothetical protein
MQQTTVVNQPNTNRKYVMRYDTDAPLMVTLVGDGGSLEFPMDVLAMMVRSWELEVIHDHFEHRPVKGYVGESE